MSTKTNDNANPEVGPALRSDASDTNPELVRTPDTGTSDSRKEYPPSADGFIERFSSTFRKSLPYQGTVGAPFFDGTNVSDFLKTWDILTYDHNVSDSQARDRILLYITPQLRELVEALPEYHANDSENYNKVDFYRAMKREYRDQDWESLKNSREYLHRIVAQRVEKETPLKEFVILFDRASENLYQEKKINEVDRCCLFIQGLPKWARTKIIKQVKFDPDNVSTYQYTPMLEEATKAYRLEEKQRRFDEVMDPGRARNIEDHLKKVAQIHKTLDWDSLPNPPEIKAQTLAQPAIPVTVVNTHPGAASGNTLAPIKTPRKNVNFKDEKPAADLDDVTKQFEKLSIRQVETQKEIKGIKEMFTAFSGQLQEQIFEKLDRAVRSESSQPQGGYRGVGRGGYGGGRGRGGQTQYPARERYDNDGLGYGQPSQPNGTGAARSVQVDYDEEVEAYAAQGEWADRTCFGCEGRDWNNKPVDHAKHFSHVMCPLMIELINRGCCHRDPDTGKYCIGTFIPNTRSVPIFFVKDRRYCDQIVAQTNGTEWDYFHEKRAANIARKEEDAKLALQEQKKGSGNYAYGQPDTLQNTERVAVEANFNALSTDDGRTVEQSYGGHRVSAFAASQSKAKRNLDKQDSARKLWEEKKKKEAKMPHVRGSRTKSLDPTEPMNVDDSEDELEVPRTQTQVNDPDYESEAPPARRKKATVPLPKLQPGVKKLIQIMKTPNPAATLALQLQNDLRPYSHIFDMTRRAHQVFSELTDPNDRDLRAAQAELNNTHQQIEAIQSGESVDLERDFEDAVGTCARTAVGLELEELVRQEKVVGSPKISFTIHGTKSFANFEGLIDSGAEINVLPTEYARELGGTHHKVKKFKLATATGSNFEFDGYCEFKVTLAKNVFAMLGFFLFPNAPKILLGQPFILKFRMAIKYNRDGSWTGVFTDSKRMETCTIKMLQPLEIGNRPSAQRPQFIKQRKLKEEVKPYVAPRVTEVTDEDEDEIFDYAGIAGESLESDSDTETRF